jgi:epoxyqueuosine reductase QueG
LHEANAYLRELATLSAYYPSVRCAAIGLLDKNSLVVLEKISQEEFDTQFGVAAIKRIEQLRDDRGLLDKLFHS